jgi:flagellar motor switch protein FliM
LLAEIHREIGRLMAARLSARLRTDFESKATSFEQMRFADWSRHLGPEHTFLGFELRPFNRPCVLALENGFLFAAVERILGGSGRSARSTRANLSEAELTVAEAIWSPLVECIARGFARLCAVQVDLLERAASADGAVTLPGQEVVLAFEFMPLSASMQGRVHLAVPYAGRASHLPALHGGIYCEDRLGSGPHHHRLEQRMRGVEAELTVVLAAREVPLREVLGLQVGDVMQLRSDSATVAEARVQGQVKFQGQIGRVGRSLGFRVDTVLTDSSREVEDTRA